MHLIKLDATDSTNQYLKELAVSKTLKDCTVIRAIKQEKGRGQMGSVWHSEEGKNLTFSILKYFSSFKVEDQIKLNCVVSLAVYKTLQELAVPDVRVKWPNDIMSGNHKVCGILIENMLKGSHIQQAIIGIGLNVNQTQFGNLEKVSSLKLLLGSEFDLDTLLEKLVVSITSNLDVIQTKNWIHVKRSYEEALYRKDKPSTFEGLNGNQFSGFIREVDIEGKLVIELEDKLLKQFAVKEVKLLN
ncbi:biotin--[acetyl-CoA-carboxylase] ligase [uncultured Croceitalea sp.]|uniref:biotin--[acetyl-CoA-carboxylase] ligase n=1 Tax=uncultured Croceitalea sp. TaxID=1798908 RepID=UPI003305AE3F